MWCKVVVGIQTFEWITHVLLCYEELMILAFYLDIFSNRNAAAKIVKEGQA